MHSPLLESWTFRSGAIAKNRIALAPLTNQQSDDDGALGEDERRWLVRRAQGGFGLVETCAAYVSKDGKGFDGQLGFEDEAQLPRLERLTRELAAEGALGIVQLYHGGVRAPSRLTGAQPWSASSFEEDTRGFEAPRAATQRDLEAVSDAFVRAAVLAQRAGFAGIELHAAHGYLLSQFLSRSMNQRTDEWGGDLAGRARLLRRLTASIRQRLPAPFIVGVRLSIEDRGYARGLDAGESAQVAAWLVEDGVDFIHLSLWDVYANLQKRPEQHPLGLVRQHVPREVALIAAGKIWTLEDARFALERGADIVALGKAGILNPQWPKQHDKAGFVPRRGPLTPEELAALDVGPRFSEYLRRFPDMVQRE